MHVFDYFYSNLFLIGSTIYLCMYLIIYLYSLFVLICMFINPHALFRVLMPVPIVSPLVCFLAPFGSLLGPLWLALGPLWVAFWPLGVTQGSFWAWIRWLCSMLGLRDWIQGLASRLGFHGWTHSLGSLSGFRIGLQASIRWLPSLLGLNDWTQ